MEDIGKRKSCYATTILVTKDSDVGDGDTVGDGDADNIPDVT